MSQNLVVTVASGDSLDVRAFSVDERLSYFFRVTLTVRSANPDIDFDAVIGQAASFQFLATLGQRTWTGVCDRIHQLHADSDGLSTYQLTIVPSFWLLTHRRNHRIFQMMSELEIVQQVLGEWGIEPTLKISETYKKRKYRVQYAESDFDFVNRMLEDCGITYYFDPTDPKSTMVLDDAPQKGDVHAPLAYRDSPTWNRDEAGVSRIEVLQHVRPGKYTVQDHDYRRPPSFPLKQSVQGGLGSEEALELYHYVPGGFLFKNDAGGDTPHADDRGATRTDEKEGLSLAQRRLDAKRSQGKRCVFVTNAYDVAASTVVSIFDHARSDLTIGKTWLVQHAVLSGAHAGEWTLRCEAVSTEIPFRPALKTPKPRVEGAESATVVGPPGEEIHCDEFGRVRVQFHWDRYGQWNEDSSCWVHVNQPWSGTGYGGSNLPRVGQEVIVDFLGGDPDRPVIMGRVYTQLQQHPYKLPDNKTQSGWKSNSTNKTGGYNEIMFEDKAGSELVRQQAQKDRSTLVKHNEKLDVGNDRLMTVGSGPEAGGGNNAEGITGNEAVVVGGFRIVMVDGAFEEHIITHDITSISALGNRTFETKLAFNSHSKTIQFKADDKIELLCGSSSITMTPDWIIIDAKKTIINPGAPAVAAANNGQLPKPQAQIEAEAAKKKADDEAAAAQKRQDEFDQYRHDHPFLSSFGPQMVGGEYQPQYFGN